MGEYWIVDRARTVIRSAVVLWVILMVTAAVAWLTFPSDEIDSTAGVLAAALCWVIVGAILTLKVPSNSVGPLALLAGSAWVIYEFGIGYGAASLASTGPGLWGDYFFAWVGSWVGALLPIGVTLLILVFPSGRPIGWWRLLMFAPIGALVSTAVGAALFWGLPLPTLIDQDLMSNVDEYGFVDAGFIVGFVSAIPATVSIVARYRRAASIERQQIKWFLGATSLFALVFVVTLSIDDSNETFWWVLSVALAAIPLAIILAVLRYRLYDVDRILSRTISYVVVLGILTSVYLLGLTAMTSFLPSDSSLAIATSTLAVAALFNPVRRRVQAWVERRFNRARYDAQRGIDGFSGSLREDLDPDTVVRGWIGVVSETMEPASISVWVRNDFETVEL